MAGVRAHSEFEAELQALRDGLLLMAGRVEQMISDAAEALAQKDAQAGRAVVKADARVNQAEVDIDDLCIRILARRQPMGPDLRFITQALKMVTDLERIGDLAVNIAERAQDVAQITDENIHPGIARMASLARGMVHEVIDAFIEQNAAKARKVIDGDDEIDDLYSDVFNELLDRVKRTPEEAHRFIHVQSAAKFLERIGDHACNLAEQVVFMVEGQDIRHAGSLADSRRTVSTRPDPSDQ